MELLAFQISDTAGTQQMTSHTRNEIMACESGEIKLTVGGEVYLLKAGDIACIPAGVMHAGVMRGQKKNCVFFFQPTGEAWMEQFQIFHDEERCFSQLCSMAANALLRESEEEKKLASLLGEVMLQLLRCWGAAGHTNTNLAVKQIDQRIRQCFADPDFNLAAEIEKTGYSSGYFRRIFKEAIGRPPQAQLNHVRIEHAKVQLRIYRDHGSIHQIALESGFHDPYYFSRIFKQHEGLSPQQYIESL